MEETMVLGRIGHYHLPGSGDGSCQTALVVDVVGSEELGQQVNLTVWTHEGDSDPHLGVPVTPVAEDHATFHLNRQCPWGR